MQSHHHTAILYTFIFCITSSLWCMEPEQKPIDKIELVRKYGLTRYYLTRWCNKKTEAMLPEYAADRIMRYTIPEIPYECKLFWWKQIDLGQLQDTTEEPQSKMHSPFAVWRNEQNKLCYANPNIANYIDTIFKQHKDALNRISFALFSPNKKYLAIVLSHLQLGSGITYIHYEIPLYSIPASDEDTEPKLIKCLTKTPLRYITFDPTSTFLAMNTERFMKTEGFMKFAPDNTIQIIQLYDTQKSELIACPDGNFHKPIDFSNDGMLLYNDNQALSLAPLWDVEKMCMNPTYEQARLLLTYTDTNKKTLAKNKQRLMHILYPETTTKGKGCVIS